jgi:hypothetical protein
MKWLFDKLLLLVMIAAGGVLLLIWLNLAMSY